MSDKKLYVHILLDRSGSMEDCRDTTISAFNEYVSSLRADAGLSARISLALFDDQSMDRVFSRVQLAEIPKLTRDTFVPRGMTPLNDAIGWAVSDIDGVDLAKDENVVFVVLTDGLENASREHTTQTVKLLLEDRRKTRNWLVVYLGANQDAFVEGEKRGMPAATTMQFDTDRVEQAVAAVARASKSFAARRIPSAAEFTPAERAKSRK